MTTGEIIKNLRLAKGLSQEELGVRVGVKKAAINKYETDLVVNLKRDMIQKLADALEVSPITIMGWDEEQPSTPKGEELSSDEEQIQLLLRDASPEVKREFLAFLRFRMKQDAQEG